MKKWQIFVIFVIIWNIILWSFDSWSDNTWFDEEAFYQIYGKLNTDRGIMEDSVYLIYFLCLVLWPPSALTVYFWSKIFLRNGGS